MKPRPEFVSIGYVSRAHGIKGEVAVFPITDDPEQFMRPMEFFLSDDQDSRERIVIERVRARKGSFIVKIRGINDRNAAEEICHRYLQRRLSDDENLAQDEYFIFDLIGLTVKTIDGVDLGIIADVLVLPANDVYVVRKNSREILIPVIKSVVKRVDLENEVVYIEPMEGLLS
ncbi:MAG: 16S rRNA processing protein RimM [Calditrichaeota bacterium]|nr:16S rRNA processing protein RimM [Calditrichota bacterium]